MKFSKDIENNKFNQRNEKSKNNENNEINESIKIIESRKLELNRRINEFKDLNYDSIRKELDSVLKEEKEILIAKNTYDNESKSINKEFLKLNEDIAKKEEIRNKLFKIKNLRNFIDGDFLNLVETIERKVMLRVHNDFNELFVKWFSILVDDENMIVSLDEEFSPVIEQNGYNTDYLFLSGGEKTAGALAYRLALNQVINNLVSHIKTKDLLILDEPTDGFSEEQLDRLRLILDELDIKQVIIVSHES